MYYFKDKSTFELFQQKCKHEELSNSQIHIPIIDSPWEFREDIDLYAHVSEEWRNPNGECKVWHVIKARQRGQRDKKREISRDTFLGIYKILE